MVPAAGTPPARVLVVEDHPTQQLLMQWWLRGLQLEVDVASDGEQAFAAWKTGRPDLVFTDDRMPGQGGGGLVQAIRQHEREAGWPPVPIIGMSAEPDHMRWMAVDHVLAKPITARRLREAIRRVMPALPLVEPSPAGALAGQACDDAVPAVPAVPPLAVLAQRFGSAAVAAELVCTLRCSLEEDLHALQAAWADADADAGEKAAAQCLHRMAGGLGSLGLVELARWLRELNESDRPTCTAHRARIQSRLQDCIAQLNQLENDNPPADTAATGTVASRPPQAPPAGSAC
jgi:two-component system sensor histidine kinase EvgS